MKTSAEIEKIYGLSRARVTQFARQLNLTKFGQMYMWDEESEKALAARIGKVGRKVTK